MLKDRCFLFAIYYIIYCPFPFPCVQILFYLLVEEPFFSFDTYEVS